MAKYFAKLDSDNVVLSTTVLQDSDAPTEEAGIAKCREIFGWESWKQTYRDEDPNPRGQYAGIGMKYDEAIDKFIKLQPYASWTLNSSTGLWEAPVAYPETFTSGVADDGVTAQTHPDSYDWDETNQQWTKRS